MVTATKLSKISGNRHNPGGAGMSGTPEEFDTITKTIFSPIYPVIARLMLKRYGRNGGFCLDLGSGPGSLSRAIAERSRLTVYSLDSDSRMSLIGKKNAISENISGRVNQVTGDVNSMPFCTSSFDLVVSRGSYMFWDDLAVAFREAERVLKPGGIAYIGGGFGSEKLKHEVFAKMRERDPRWDSGVKRRSSKVSFQKLQAELKCSRVKNCNIITDESGIWVEIKK